MRAVDVVLAVPRLTGRPAESHHPAASDALTHLP